MDLIKLVDYSDSDSESNTTTAKTPRATPTPITFRGKRIFRRIIQSGSNAPMSASTVTKPTAPSRKPTAATMRRNNKAVAGTTSSSTVAADKMEQEGTPLKRQWSKEETTRLKLNFETPITPDCKAPALTLTPLSTICSAASSTLKSCESTPFKNSEKGTPMKNKRWTRDETNRLKIALKASVNPTTDEHWEKICRSVGGNHSIEDCRERALKLKWKPPTPSTKIDRSNKPELNKKEEENGGASYYNSKSRASPWTRAAVNMRKSRKSVECHNKFFSDNVTDLTFTELNLDDSLFTTAFNTPPQQAKAARRPFLIRVVAEEDEEKSSSDENYY